MDDEIFGKSNEELNNNASETECSTDNSSYKQENTTEYPQAESYKTAPENNYTQPDNNTAGNPYNTYVNQYGYNQNNNNTYNQNQYGYNSYNNTYGQNQYNQTQYGQTPYGQTPYGQTPYGQNQYGQNQYGQYQQFGYNSNNDNGKSPKKKNKGMKVFIGIVIALVLLSVFVMVSLFTGDSSDKTDSKEPSSSSSQNSTSNSEVGDLTVSDSALEAGEAAVVAEIAQKYNVGILVYQNDSLYTEGSGVIALEDDSGKYTYVVTCAHVVNYRNVALSVLLQDGAEYPADLVGFDTRTDLAVVRIEASGLPKGEFADSENLIVGQTVYAVGNPGGSEFFGSVSDGIISAIDRPISSSTGYEMECIQHTAAINPGNSGGALVNGEGKVIGINSMKIASTEYEGMGFAVPSSVVVEVFNNIIENGYVAGRAKLGISYTTPSDYSQTYSMYVQVKGLPTGTIVIANIAEDSDLANKDVKVGDMITQVNGKDMTSTGMLSDMIEEMSAGDQLTLTIVRLNTRDWTQTEQKITVKLVEDKGNTTVSQNEPQNDSSSGGQYGSDYDDLYEYFREYFGNNGGYGY